MGNGFSCVLPLERQTRKRGGSWKGFKFPASILSAAASKSRARDTGLGPGHGDQEVEDEELLQKQALAAMLLFQQQLRFERSTSVRSQKSSGASKQQNNSVMARSASVRARGPNDPLLQPHELLQKREDALLNIDTKRFVLVHGGGFGAWCWYKLIAFLEGAGFTTCAIDLAGSGIDATDPNSITTLAEYTKPLIDFLGKLEETEKVILVGHDIGGACISYAMEMFPQLIAKSVFVSGTMITNGQRAFDALEVTDPDKLLPKAQVLNYSNKDSQTPSSIEFNKEYVKDLFFGRTPAKDVALATVSIRPIPFGPIMERINLSPEKYGAIPRYYVLTTDDHAFSCTVQENLIRLNPPKQVFRLKGSDHSPFFSKPQALYKVLVEIARYDYQCQATY